MLYSHHSNQMEQLIGSLLARIASPVADPMAAEIILVQNPAMARWLSQRIAEAQGIAANLEFPLPASFVWRIHQAWLPDMPAPAAWRSPTPGAIPLT